MKIILLLCLLVLILAGGCGHSESRSREVSSQKRIEFIKLFHDQYVEDYYKYREKENE